MKKSYILAGVLVLACALGLIVYLNMKGPSKASTSDTTVATQENGDDSDSHSNHAHGEDSHKPTGLGEIVKSGDPKNQALESVVVNSRIAEEFRFLDEQMEAQYDRLKQSGAGPEELAIFERLHAQLKGEDLLNQFRNVLKDKFSEGELAELNDIYKDPAYAKYKAMEEANRTPEGMKAISEFSRTFKPESLAPEMRAEINNWVESSGAVDNMMGMLKNVETIFPAGMGNPNKQDTKAYEDLLRKSLHSTMVAAAAYNFKNSNINEIKELSHLVGNPLHRAADLAKTEFVGETLVKVVKPEVEQQAKNLK